MILLNKIKKTTESKLTLEEAKLLSEQSLSAARKILGNIPELEISFETDRLINKSKKQESFPPGRIQIIVKRFHTKAYKNYQKNFDPPDKANQDYFRGLIIRAYIKKFNSIPAYCGTRAKPKFFGYASPNLLYKSLIYERAKSITKGAAQRAAGFLEEKFEPPMKINLDD